MLVVRPRDRCARPSQFVTEHDVMGAVSAIAGTIAVVEMLEHADQPSVIKTCSVTGLSLHQPSECIGHVGRLFLRPKIPISVRPSFCGLEFLSLPLELFGQLHKLPSRRIVP